ncbi:MAG: FUSC family protein [Galactobacter sp.]|uniref:FUSC family protein n=1 Tax=Galactobacter sp. TaxID=2676125 RepID=UPI0025C03FC4|nr:FUSC family protein [Galactobacter sp.]
MSSSRFASFRGALRHRAKAGVRRVRISLPKIILATFASVFSYWFAETVLGHDGPLFAATSALISLNFATTSHVRRTLEVAIGCTFGIVVGDLLMTAFGQGLWQAAVVVFVSLIISRFLDSGVVFSMQFGLQSLLVVLLPLPESGPFSRSLDAITGGTVALILVMLWPKDPSREPAKALSDLLKETAAAVRELSRSLAQDDAKLAWHSLVRARGTQSLVDAAAREMKESAEFARISPSGWRRRGEVAALQRVQKEADLAVRNIRVLCRRTATLMSNEVLSERIRADLADAMETLADAVLVMSSSVADPSPHGRDRYMSQTRSRLVELSSQLAPHALGASDPQAVGLVMMLRPLTVDLLEATGIPHDEAVRYLPTLKDLD